MFFFGISIALIRRSHSAADSDRKIVTTQMCVCVCVRATQTHTQFEQNEFQFEFRLRCNATDGWMDMVLLDPISNVIISSFIRQAIQFRFYWIFRLHRIRLCCHCLWSDTAGVVWYAYTAYKAPKILKRNYFVLFTFRIFKVLDSRCEQKLIFLLRFISPAFIHWSSPVYGQCWDSHFDAFYNFVVQPYSCGMNFLYVIIRIV